MSRSSLAAFSALWRAYGEGRLERSFDLVDPDCELTLADGRSTVRGHDGLREWLASTRRDWKTVTVTYDDAHEDHPGCVVGVGHVTASGPDGAAVERPLACVAEFRDGRLVRGRAFRDRAEALAYARALDRTTRTGRPARR